MNAGKCKNSKNLCIVLCFGMLAFLSGCTHTKSDDFTIGKSHDSLFSKQIEEWQKEQASSIPDEKEVFTTEHPSDENKVSSNDTIRKVIDMNVEVQETGFYCGPAVTKSILKHFGIYKTQQELAQELSTHPITGSEYLDIANVLNHYLFQNVNPSTDEGGYHVQTLPLHSQDLNLKGTWQSRLIKNIEDGYPSVLAVDLHYLYPTLTNANHVVLCIGYEKEKVSEEISLFYILDPYYGVQDTTYGGLKTFTPNELWMAQVENEEPAYIW